MIAFLSLVATTEAQNYEAQAPQPIGQFRGFSGQPVLEDYGVPAPVGDNLPDYDDAVIVDAGVPNDIRGQESVLPLTHFPNTHYHAGQPVATFRMEPAAATNPMPLGGFRGPLPTPAPEGTPSSVGPYGPDCVNPCQGWTFRNKCPGIPCTDADKQRWQQHYNNNPIPQIQQVQPTPAELMESVELNEIENELVAGKNFSVDIVETEEKAAIEKIQVNANLEMAKVGKMAQLVENVVDIAGLNKAEAALDRVIDEEAQMEEEELAALLQFQRTQPDLFMGQIPAVGSQPGMNLPYNLPQQSVGYQTVTDQFGNARNIPNQSGAYETAPQPAQGSPRFQQTYIPANAALQAAQRGVSLPSFQYSVPPGEALRLQQPGQEFMPLPPQQVAYAPAGDAQSLYVFANADPALNYGSMADPELQARFI